MRIAFFSPLNPQRSGISDYAEALLPRLAAHADLEVFVEEYQPSNPAIAGRCAIRHWREFEPDYRGGRYDAVLYHLGNNPHHVYIYDLAMRIPGAVVLHDFNLHYLLAEATIVRGRWDEYFAEVEYNGGPEALATARRAREGHCPFEYERLAMNRRLLERSAALIVHSRFVANLATAGGFRGPLAVIPHGAEAPAVDRDAARRRLGINGGALFGAFGFLKPYKRITSVIQAFSRLARYRPEARLILVGEEHPHYPLRGLIRDLGQEERIRILGHVPLDEFVQNIAACDVCLNLRYPTAGETSGSLLREMALGKATIVSDIGWFAELPDEACLKIPPQDGEPEWLFEYMNTLMNQPALAEGLGRNAAAYVQRECLWEKVAAQYAAFLAGSAAPAAGSAAPSEIPPDLADCIMAFSQQTRESEQYARTHLRRMVRTLELTPGGGPGTSALEMGCYLQMTPALQKFLGYENVRGCYYGPAGHSDLKAVRSAQGEEFRCHVDLFDAEKDPYPYADASFDTVLCCELLEHLYFDPMHMMAEVNRVLKPGGHLVLTTPNITSLRALDAALNGLHPGFYHVYVKPNAAGVVDPRHNREYSPQDLKALFGYAGFEIERLESGWYAPLSVHEEARNARMAQLLEKYGYSRELRGDVLYVVGRKSGTVRERWPRELYDA